MNKARSRCQWSLTATLFALAVVAGCTEGKEIVEQADKPLGLEPPRVYVANESSSTVSVFRWDPTGGPIGDRPG